MYIKLIKNTPWGVISSFYTDDNVILSISTKIPFKQGTTRSYWAYFIFVSA